MKKSAGTYHGRSNVTDNAQKNGGSGTMTRIQKTKSVKGAMAKRSDMIKNAQ